MAKNKLAALAEVPADAVFVVAVVTIALAVTTINLAEHVLQAANVVTVTALAKYKIFNGR